MYTSKYIYEVDLVLPVPRKKINRSIQISVLTQINRFHISKKLVIFEILLIEYINEVYVYLLNNWPPRHALAIGTEQTANAANTDTNIDFCTLNMMMFIY